MLRILLPSLLVAGCTKPNVSRPDLSVYDQRDLAASTSDLSVDGGADDLGGDGSAIADGGEDAGSDAGDPDLSVLEDLSVRDLAAVDLVDAARAPGSCADVDASPAPCFQCIFGWLKLDGGVDAYNCGTTNCPSQTTALELCGFTNGCCSGCCDPKDCRGSCITTECPALVKGYLDCYAVQCPQYVERCR